ncbi:MAG TPA: penicillin acylase family protein [Thermoleophilaceae bacterium]|nr:penicillin acylase family protein [Thermoleophilaceae bacterium]
MRRGRIGAILLAVTAIGASALAAGPAGSGAQTGEIVIKRDEFGVPHVFAPDRRSVSYGAGYALAQDRLWQLHIFRHLGKGELSQILGPLVIDIDRDTRFWTYTAEERARRFETWPKPLQRDLEAFVAGINAWIDEANADPAKLPFEFTMTGEAPIREWTIDDSMGLQDFLILTFGAGGGNELQNAALAQRLIGKYGAAEGLRAFGDLVRTVDRDAEPTIPRGLKWKRTPTYARLAKVRQVRRLTRDARLSLADKTSTPASDGVGTPGDGRGTLEQLALAPDIGAVADAVDRRLSGLRSLDLRFKFGSNAQIVGPRLAKSRNSLQTGGPQVSYAIPQFLADFGMHAPGMDITGMTFAGVGPAVLIGRGNGFAWTTTTGSSDLTDTYVEQLNPENPREYLFRDRWEPMECRTEEYVMKGVAELETQEICRTRHGPVVAFDEANGVAYSVRYGWMDRELGTTRGFWGFNRARGLRSYATSASQLASNHNMFYTDDRGNFGYWHPGNHPRRAPGVDLRLPQDGTGKSEWRGLLPVQRVPHAVNFKRGWLVNWNNLPAKGWPRERAFDARDGVDDLSDPHYDRRTPDPFGGRVRGKRWDFDGLSASLRHAAFADHEYDWYESALPRPKELESDLAKAALDVTRSWSGFRVDEDGDGMYDSAGYTILRVWIGQLRDAAFGDDLGDDAGRARSSTELWHLFSPDSRHDLRFDWLNGRDRREVAAEAFTRAVERLEAEFGSDEPATWLSKARLEHYTRLNADLFTDTGLGAACGELEAIFNDECDDAQEQDSGWPGDVADHIEMDRGTYNHVVEYLTRATRVKRLGAADSRAGSVIPPGQSGFVSPAGQEDPHFEDQLDDYIDWTYKPMPLSLEDLEGTTESTETLPIPDSY